MHAGKGGSEGILLEYAVGYEAVEGSRRVA
jgi:hypothetical protein